MSISFSLSTFFSLRRGVTVPGGAILDKLEAAGLGSLFCCAARGSFSLAGPEDTGSVAEEGCLRGKSEEDEPGDGLVGLWNPDGDWPGYAGLVEGARLSLPVFDRPRDSPDLEALAGVRWDVERSREGVTGDAGLGAGR